jgi:hypothetical protein
MRRVDLIGPVMLLVSIGAVAVCVTSSPDDDNPPGAHVNAKASALPSVAPTSASDVVALLDKSSQAAMTTTYQGEQVVASWRSTGTQSLTLDVTHQAGVGTVVEVPSAPGSSTGGSTDNAVMQADADIFDPSGSMNLLLQHYVCTDAGKDEVAGRSTAVVDVRRPVSTTSSTSGPVVARFWLDARTGLLLRREVYDVSGRIVGTSRFATLTMGSAAAAEPSPTPSPLPKGWTDVMTSAQLASLRAHGWQLPAELDGLSLYDARTAVVPDADEHDSGEVVQVGYSDGVSTISLFEQVGRLDPASVVGWTAARTADYLVYERDMLSTQMIWSGDGMVYTLVADAAPDVVDGVVDALPHGNSKVSMMMRAHRGVDRVGSWLDPFA